MSFFISAACFQLNLATLLTRSFHDIYNILFPPAQVGCTRQVLRAGTLGRPRGIRWGGRQEGGSGWGIHVNPWLIHVNVWQKPLHYCKVISLQLIKMKNKQTNKQKNILFLELGGRFIIAHFILSIFKKQANTL